MLPAPYTNSQVNSATAPFPASATTTLSLVLVENIRAPGMKWGIAFIKFNMIPVHSYNILLLGHTKISVHAATCTSEGMGFQNELPQ